MKVKIPKKLKLYFVPEEGPEEGVSVSKNSYDVEVQVLDNNSLILWFPENSKKRLWRNERLLSSGLVLMLGKEDKEDN